MNNDLSLLRPFDLEAAKRGEPMFLQLNNGSFNDIPRTYLAGPDDLGRLCFTINNGLLDVAHKSDLRMAPLCWVEGKPVYKGDVLYSTGGYTGKHRVDRVDDSQAWQDDNSGGGGRGYVLVRHLTWTPPNVKREGWINIYPSRAPEFVAAGTSNAYVSEEEANDHGHEGRIACIRIEWEEPAC